MTTRTRVELPVKHELGRVLYHIQMRVSYRYDTHSMKRERELTTLRDEREMSGGTGRGTRKGES